MTILDLTVIDDSSEALRNTAPYTAVRVPPGVLLTVAQFEEWCRLRDIDAEQADRYVSRIESESRAA